MKVGIDAGHGMSNRQAGTYDPGACYRFGGESFAEADITLKYALTLKQLLSDGGIGFFMTRTSSADPAPLGGRALRAAKAGCDRFVSLHVNSAAGKPSGLEVLYRDGTKDAPLASALQAKLLGVTRFDDRGIQKRTDLAVLRFKPGPAVLIELGFINNDHERTFLMDRNNRIAICQAIVDVLKSQP